MPSTGTSAVTAAGITAPPEEQLPTFDGSQVTIASWLRDLKRNEHLLSSDIAYFATSGAASSYGGKTAVSSVHHAHLLHHNLLDAENFSVINPPPLEDQFFAIYATIKASDANSPLPDNPSWSNTIKDQFMLNPTRLKQIDLNFRNVLLALITSPGRKNHYQNMAGNSGVKLMRLFIADRASGMSAYIQDPHIMFLKTKLKKVLALRLSCVSQDEFNNIRDQVYEINGQLPAGEGLTDHQQCDHYRSLLTDLNSVALTIQLNNDMMINQVPYGDLQLTVEAITRTLTRAMIEEQQRAAEAGSALLTEKQTSRPAGTKDPSKHVYPPCAVCGKTSHSASRCYQNPKASDIALKRAPKDTPAGMEWARRTQAKASGTDSDKAPPAPADASHALACADDMDDLIMAALENGADVDFTQAQPVAAGRAAFAASSARTDAPQSALALPQITEAAGAPTGPKTKPAPSPLPHHARAPRPQRPTNPRRRPPSVVTACSTRHNPPPPTAGTAAPHPRHRAHSVDAARNDAFQRSTGGSRATILEVKSTHRRGYPASLRIEEMPGPPEALPPPQPAPAAASAPPAAAQGRNTLALLTTSATSALLAICFDSYHRR